jgi:hypothetical protein
MIEEIRDDLFNFLLNKIWENWNLGLAGGNLEKIVRVGDQEQENIRQALIFGHHTKKLSLDMWVSTTNQVSGSGLRMQARRRLGLRESRSLLKLISYIGISKWEDDQGALILTAFVEIKRRCQGKEVMPKMHRLNRDNKHIYVTSIIEDDHFWLEGGQKPPWENTERDG